MTKLTPEALDALLAEHNPGKTGIEVDSVPQLFCYKCRAYSESGCTIYLLASEVRDARPFEHCWASELEAARKVVVDAVTLDHDWQNTPCFTCQICHRAWNQAEGVPPDHASWCSVAEYLRVMEEQR